MKEMTRAAGKVRIRLPDSAGEVTDVTASSDDASSRRTGRGRRTEEQAGARTVDAGTAESMELDIMLDALAEQRAAEDSPLSSPMDLVDRFAVDVGDGAAETATRRGGGAGQDRQELDIDVDLLPEESAVVLVQQDDTYEWHYPAARKDIKPQRRGSQTGSGQSEQQQLTFRIPIGSEGRLPRPTRGSTHRGPITGFIKGKIQGFILKFVAGKTIGPLTRRLERGVTEGPVTITSATDALQWIHQKPWPTEALPADRARRVLLLVHGTFSSTVGSFGALTSHAEGQKMLQQALDHYDLVIGYDHYTLSETPDQNAEAILDSLLPLIEDGQSLEIDAMAFSRGGLVYRYLSEVALPPGKLPIVCRKAVFVGCVNAGTELANDSNWKYLIDFYTNMVAGATRLIGLAPGAALPTRILRQGIKVIGSLVTYIAQDSVANHSVPGVAAMEPAGDFVEALNRLPPHRSSPAARAYYAIGSNFEPTDSDDAFRLGKRLVLKVADGFVDKLMGKANDLVVNNDSMFVIDPVPQARLVEQRSVDANGRIYHTVYFHQPMIATTCGQWLGIMEPPAVTHGTRQSSIASPSLPRNWWADAVTDDFVLLSFTTAVPEAAKRLRAAPARTVIIQRVHEGSLLYYGFMHSTLLSAFQGVADHHITVGDFLGLHEWQSRFMDLDDALATGSPSALHQAAEAIGAAQGAPGSDLAVITRAGKPIGVIVPLQPAEAVMLDSADKPRTASRRGEIAGMVAAKPSQTARPPTRGPTRGRSPSTAAPEAREETSDVLESTPGAATGSAAETVPEMVWCHMHAVMPEELRLDDTGTLEVTLSRDLIARETGISGGAEFKTDRPVIIQVVARKNCDVIGSDRVEVEVPAPGEEVPVFFDIKVLHTGMGEVDVFARQGNQPLIELTLHPRFLTRRARPVDRSTAVTGVMQPAVPRQEIPDVLYIYDVQVGNQRILEFNFQSRQAGIQGRFRGEPFKNETARQDYIANLYKEIEEFWADDQNDYDAFIQKLMARGANLFDKLVPVDIQQRLWDARDKIKAIQVISDEPFIPWELLYLKQPGKKARPDSCFLVEKGMFRWVSNTNYAPVEIRIRDDHFSHIVPDYPQASGYALPGAQAERSMLETEFGAQAIKPDTKSVTKALTTPGVHDVLHFACHGIADSSSIWNSGLLMKGRMAGGDYVKDELRYEWVDMFADMHATDGGSGPLVFLNACQSGRHGYNLTGTGGFAEAFVKAGASAFIGSQWSVGDQPAFLFSQTLYSELINNGSTMMDAVARSRAAARNNKEITWLAYAVYADPYARITRGQG